MLIKNFDRHYHFLLEHGEKGALEMLLDKTTAKDISRHASDAVLDLANIINVAKIECAGYIMIDQPIACKDAIAQFESFIKNYHLDNRDTLLRINSGSTSNNCTPIDTIFTSINSIVDMSNRIKLPASNKNYLIKESTVK